MTMNEIRAYFADQRKLHKGIEIVEPVYAFLTAFMTPDFRDHVTRLGVRHIYDKPIQKSQLYRIFVGD